MANKVLMAAIGVMLLSSVLSMVVTGERDSSWLKSLLNSDELAELESKEGANNDDVITTVDKRPSWVSGRDLGNEYYRYNNKRIIEFKKDLEDQLALIRNLLHQKTRENNKKLRY